MRINNKVLAATIATALLAACGGGGSGGSNSLENSNIPIITEPLEFDSEIKYTVDQHGNLTYLSVARIEPKVDTAQTVRQYVDSGFQLQRSGVSAIKIEDDSSEVENDVDQFDWYHEETFTRDLIRFADTEENLDEENQSSVDFPDVTVYSQTIPVSLYGQSLDLAIFGLRNKTDDEAFVLFDQYTGLVSGGSIISGTPTGNQTYRGYNLFRYTPHSENKIRVLHSGTFEMEVDFSTGTGAIQANSLSHIMNNLGVLSGMKLSGNVKIDTKNGAFAGRNLKFTEVSVRQNTHDGGLELFEETEGGTAKIQGLFHGIDGKGVSGIYQHDVGGKEQFRGSIVGRQNFELNDNPQSRDLFR